MRECKECGSLFTPKHNANWYCSSTCQVTSSRRVSEQKRREKVQSKYIDGLHYKTVAVMEMTLGEYYEARPDKLPRMIRKDSMRYFAHAWNPEMKDQPCERCGYDKHTEIAHIRPISDFPVDTPLKVVHDRKNLMNLCPNCHWEFDNLGK